MLFKAMLCVNLSGILPDLFLEKVDRTTMAHSMEIRVPFFDNELVDHALGLRASDKLRGGKQKSLLRQALTAWPQGVPVVMEATFGWGWLSDELTAAGLEPHLANSMKVAAWRKARGLAKSDRIDSDLLAELPMRPDQQWWEV